MKSYQVVGIGNAIVDVFNQADDSFIEMMGLPDSLLSTTYHLPYYNNVDVDTQLRFGNVSNTATTVRLYIGGVEQTGCTSTPAKTYPYSLNPGESLRVSCVGVNNGPVKIVADQNIVAAERIIYKVNNVNTSFMEMIGFFSSFFAEMSCNAAKRASSLMRSRQLGW